MDLVQERNRLQWEGGHGTTCRIPRTLSNSRVRPPWDVSADPQSDLCVALSYLSFLVTPSTNTSPSPSSAACAPHGRLRLEPLWWGDPYLEALRGLLRSPKYGHKHACAICNIYTDGVAVTFGQITSQLLFGEAARKKYSSNFANLWVKENRLDPINNK